MGSKMKIVINSLDVIEEELKDNKESMLAVLKVMNETRAQIQKYLSEHNILTDPYEDKIQ